MLSRTSPRALRLALWLIALTAAYNVVEGVVAIASGLAAHSITLLAFGADSYLEVAAAAAVGWRLLAPDEEEGERREERALRFVGVTFLVLAVAVTLEAILALAGREGAVASPVGIALLAASLLVMPLVAIAKLKVATDAAMPALAAEARETVACSYLSLTALAGLLATWALGWWWLDAIAALAMVPWLVREGLEGIRGDACFDGEVLCWCRSCWWGIRDCPRSCCAAAA
ncbi:MAG: cation transporter [Dehalococcoidia bacterium]|nr:cation transporter [Dehalococcoidia bacterium]